MEVVSKLDDIGKPAWIALTVLGLIFFWPLGLLLLGYLLGSGRMGCWGPHSAERWQHKMDRMQRRMQDAVSTRDSANFRIADAQLDSAMHEVEVLRKNPVAEPGQIDALRAAIRSYYTLARRTSERMIAGESGDSILAATKSVTSQYGAVRRDLEANAAADEQRIDHAFTNATRLDQPSRTRRFGRPARNAAGRRQTDPRPVDPGPDEHGKGQISRACPVVAGGQGPAPQVSLRRARRFS